MEEKRHGGAGRVIVVILILAVLLAAGAFFLFGGRVRVETPSFSTGYRYDRAKDYATLDTFPVRGLCDLVSQAGAELVGVGIAIEKGFQGGGDRLRGMGLNYHALAVIEKADENGIIFREEG